MEVLEKTRTYLVGHMQYANGRNWRDHVEEELEKLLGGGNWKQEKVVYETDQGFPTNHSATPNTVTKKK